MKEFKQIITDDGKVYIKGYMLDGFKAIEKENFPTVLIVPGGGFKKIPDRECEQIAYAFLNAGYHAFFLRYHLADEVPFVLEESIKELAQAVKVIRELEVTENMTGDLSIMGLSIGGEIVSQYNGRYHETEISEILNIETNKLKPNRILLCYPVTSFELGFPKNIDIAKQFVQNIENADSSRYIGEHCAPVFIWSTFEDSVVPIQNTLSYAMGLKSHNIPCEVHIFDKGEHGLSLATEMTTATPDYHVAHWFELALEWMKRW